MSGQLKHRLGRTDESHLASSLDSIATMWTINTLHTRTKLLSKKIYIQASRRGIPRPRTRLMRFEILIHLTLTFGNRPPTIMPRSTSQVLLALLPPRLSKILHRTPMAR